MEKLKELIKQHGRWQSLEVYVGRIVVHSEQDFSLSLENAKALLESIGKEICSQKGMELSARSSMNAVLKKAFEALGIGTEETTRHISTSLANIGQHMGNLRNDIGTTSHGRPLEEIKNRNDSIDTFTKEFLIDATEIIACFLIRNFETVSPIKKQEPILQYIDCSNFNESWDEGFGDFAMGDYSYPASEILFNVDYKAYQTEYKVFQEEAE